MESHGLWVEKYRPQDLSTYVGNEHLKSKVKRFLEDGNVPHYYYMVELVAAKPHLLKLLLIMLSVIIYILMRRMNEI